jgi:replicative DNA helicase
MPAMIEAGRQFVQAGMAPSQVVEIVFDAIRQEKFYIFTHATTKQLVQVRMEDILQERMPTDAILLALRGRPVE